MERTKVRCAGASSWSWTYLLTKPAASVSKKHGRMRRGIIRGMTQLQSTRYAVDDLAGAMDLAFDKGWTDGLPVIPPTEARVGAMLEAARLEPDQQIAFITNRQVAVTAEKVAINAVMA